MNIEQIDPPLMTALVELPVEFTSGDMAALMGLTSKQVATRLNRLSFPKIKRMKDGMHWANPLKTTRQRGEELAKVMGYKCSASHEQRKRRTITFTVQRDGGKSVGMPRGGLQSMSSMMALYNEVVTR